MAVDSGDYVRNLFNLDGRVAVVTGGGSGLGAAIAVGLAKAGAAVVVLDVNEKGARETVDAITTHRGTALVSVTDVTARGAVDEAADCTVRELGRVDVLVNSAGSAYRCPVEDFPEDRLDFILDLNLKGTYLCCQSFGRKMLERRSGSIINIASIGSFIAYPHASAYLASKGGVQQVTRAFALEWHDRGVRVNAIAPTLMDSPLTTARQQQSSVTSDFIKARMLSPRLGQPQQLVGPVVFLASDASELVTGHTLPCDDGYLIA